MILFHFYTAFSLKAGRLWSAPNWIFKKYLFKPGPVGRYRQAHVGYPPFYNEYSQRNTRCQDKTLVSSWLIWHTCHQWTGMWLTIQILGFKDKIRIISYLSKRFVLKLLLMLKEGIQAVLLHDDLWLVWEEDGVTVKRHSQLGVTQLILCVRHEHCGCSDAWRTEGEDCLETFA